MIEINRKNLTTLLSTEEKDALTNYIYNLLKNHSSDDSAVVNLSGIKTNEDVTLIATVYTKMISIKVRVTGRNTNEAIRKFKIHFSKEIERNKTKL